MARILHEPTTQQQWWEDAVIYQIYPRSFASSGGPVGDLRAIASRLDHLGHLGVDAIWLSPFYVSPQNDAGYDVADYRNVDPRFGTLDDAAELIREAHERGIRVVVDLVPNHTSDQHPWFRAALEAGPGSAERERYWFRDGRGSEPPTDWVSVFGSIAWTRVCDRPDAPGSAWEHDTSWYLNLFDSSQPDLNWANPEVREEFRSILRFWLDLGVDGFRVDVAHGLTKDPELPDWRWSVDMVAGVGDETIPPAPMWNRDDVHEVYREWRAVLAEYGADRMMVAEAWVSPASEIAKYVRPDEMHQSFNFEFVESAWTVARMRHVIAESLAAMDAVGAPTTWVLSNHDVPRATARLGLPDAADYPNGIRSGDPLPDAVRGPRRALAAHMLMHALPGSSYIWQGEELNLPEHMSLPDSLREDPQFFRTNGEHAGRDGCRVPLPWTADAPGYGFSPDGQRWLPSDGDWAPFAVEVQAADPDSPLALFRKIIAVRRELGLGHGGLVDLGEEDHIRFLNTSPDRDDLMILTAFDNAVPIPHGWEVLLASAAVDGEIPPDTTAWLTPSSPQGM